MRVLDDEGYSNNLGNRASGVFQIETKFLLRLQGMVIHFEVWKEKKKQVKEWIKTFQHKLSCPINLILFSRCVQRIFLNVYLNKNLYLQKDK